jgi:ABC-type uncharacterized transport system permease subunit
MTPVLLLIAVVGYIVGIVLAVIATVYRSGNARRGASFAFALTWVAHLGGVLQYAVLSGRVPLSNLPEYLLVLGWTVMSFHLYVWFRLRVDVTGLVLPPIGAICTFVSIQLLSSEIGEIGPPATKGPWFLFHTTVSTLGMAALCVAFAMSVIYLIQHRALKAHKTLRLMERLPALGEADQVGFRALTLGFVLLSLGIGAGLVVNASVHERLWTAEPKQIFSILAWIVFAGILVARSALGFRGKKSAYLTITGFALGLLTVLGMSL